VNAPRQESGDGTEPFGADEAELARYGYAQQLRRSMGAFSSFAIAFSLPDTRFTPSIPGSRPLVAQGGTGTYTWSLVSGTLPVGATLAPASGVIAGDVSAPGSGTIRVRVSDGVTAVEGDVAIVYRCCFF